MKSGKVTAFVVSKEDNVATLLEEVPVDAMVSIIGEKTGSAPIRAVQKIDAAHKIAIAVIPAGDAVMKFGSPIGRATRKIEVGEWVHLHNCASDVDARSNTLDVHTGAPEDTRRAYE